MVFCLDFHFVQIQTKDHPAALAADFLNCVEPSFAWFLIVQLSENTQPSVVNFEFFGWI